MHLRLLLFVYNISDYFNNNIRKNIRSLAQHIRTPVKDYDLCIILGNLLDNSFNACEHIKPSDRWIDIRIYRDNYDKFRIDCRNSVKNLHKDFSPPESLEHGFGTTNIYRTVKKNLGTTATELTENIYTTAIIIPIIDEKKRLHPLKKH